MPSKKPSPNFLTCPVEPEDSDAVKAPAPKGVPFEGGQGEKGPATGQKRDDPFHPIMSSQYHSPFKEVVHAVAGAKPKATPKEKFKKQGGSKRWIVGTVLILVLALTAPMIYAFARAGFSGLRAVAALKRVQGLAEANDASGAARELKDASAALRDARSALQSAGFWRDLPGLGTQLRALEDAASAGASTADGLGGLAGVAVELLDAATTAGNVTGEITNPVAAHRSFNDLSPEEKRAILARLDRALPDIKAAQAKVAVALDTWNRIPQNKLAGPLRQALQPVAENLPILKRSLDEAVPLLETFIPLAGYPKAADYLVVLQNSDEIRATGGFLGTWGILSVDGGDLKEFAFSDVYSLDNPASGSWKETAPAPLRDRIPAPVWFFRDVNWSPDFPTSAGMMSDFYVREIKAGTGKDVKLPDGVIAMNAPFFEGILKLTGPMTVDGVTFTSENFFDELEYEVEQRFLQKGIAVEDRKQILLKLGDALLAKITSLPASKWPELLDLATDSLDRKQIQIFARDPDVLKRLDARNWSGRTKPTNGDFLWVVDSNMSALKTDGVMRKRVKYDLDATNPESPLVTVTLTYSNDAPGFQEYRYTRYRDYVRLYVPEGATLVDVKGAMKDDRYRTGGRFVAGPVDVYKELGKTVFGAFWSIEPKTTQEIVFRYRLPQGAMEKLAENAYRLDIPKQSGNDAVSLTLDLRFGKTLKRAEPPEESERFGDARYQLESDSLTDRTFELAF
jgi:hypothetical protein